MPPNKIADDFAAINKRLKEISPHILGIKRFQCTSCKEFKAELTGEKISGKEVVQCYKRNGGCDYRFYAIDTVSK